MSRYLIVGGCGFIGTNLTKRLLDQGHDVTVIDDQSTSAPGNLMTLMSSKNAANLKFIDLDIIELDVKVWSHYEYDYIINLACPASPVWYQKDPIKTLDTCYIGTKKLLEVAHRTHARFLQASTSEIYGDPLVHPQPESYWGNVNTNGPRACYDEGKRIAETLVHEYQKLGTDTRVIRIFNTYGPHMSAHDGRVVSNFIVQALNGQPLTLYGDGQQTRSFQYIDDLLDGLLLVLHGEYNQPVNVGNPNEFTMVELAAEVVRNVGDYVYPVYLSLPQDDPKQRCPDISLMKQLYNWEPKVQLGEGLIKTIEYFRSIT